MERLFNPINAVIFLIILLSLILPAIGIASGYLDNPRVARAQQQADQYYEVAFKYKKDCLFDSYQYKLRQLNELKANIESEKQSATDVELRDHWNRLQVDIFYKVEFLMLQKVKCDKQGTDEVKLIRAPGDKSILRYEDLFTFYKRIYVITVGSTFEVVVDQYPLFYGSSILGVFDRNPGIVSAPFVKKGSKGKILRLHDYLNEQEELYGYDDEEDGQPFNKSKYLKMLPNIPVITHSPKQGKVNRTIVIFRCLKVGRTILHFEFDTARTRNPFYDVEVQCIAREKTGKDIPGIALQEDSGDGIKPGGGDVPPVEKDKHKPKKDQQKRSDDNKQSSSCLPNDKLKTVDLGPKPSGFESIAKGIVGSLLGQVTGGMLSFGGGREDAGGTFLTDNPFDKSALQLIKFGEGMDFQLAATWIKSKPAEESIFDDEDDFFEPRKKKPAPASKMPAPLISVKIPSEMAREKKYTFGDMYLIGPDCQEKNPTERYIYEVWQETKFRWSIEFWRWRNGVLTEHWKRTGSEAWSELLASGEIPLWVGAKFDGVTADMFLQDGWQLVTHWTYEENGRVYMDSNIFNVSTQPGAPQNFKFMPMLSL